MTKPSLKSKQHKTDVTAPVQLIEVRHLEKSPLNVRRTVAKGASEELKASIIAHGLMQNLVVTDAGKGKFHVIAGARRLQAIKALQKDKKLPADHAVSCQVVTEDQAAEMSLAENTIRHAMHPADEFEAYAALSDTHSAEQIAQRFGVDEKHVLQRLKLGKVAPELLDKYRDEELTLESLMAFTVTDDRKRQLAVYKSLQGWQKDNPRHIRECLTDKMLASDDKLVRFVGLKAYEKAGGRSRADLFGDTIYLEDAEIIHRLAGEKLNASAEKVKAEGWGWIEVNADGSYDFIYQCSRIKAKPFGAPEKLIKKREDLQAEYDAIDKQIDAADFDDDDTLDPLYEKRREVEEHLNAVDEELEQYLDFDPEEKKLAGCHIRIGSNGKIDIERGLVKKQDQKKLVKSSGESASDDDQRDDGKPKMPESLRRDLELYRLQAAQIEIAKHPEIAFDLAVFTMAHRVLDHMPVYTGAQITITETSVPPFVRETSPAAQQELKAIEDGLPQTWLKPDDTAGRFAAFRQLSQEDKLKIFAYCTAKSLKPQINRDDDADHFEDALALTGGDVARYWRPTTESYFKRIKTDQLLEIGRGIFGEVWFKRWCKSKKIQIVNQLDTAFAQPEKSEHGYDEAAKLKSWLPEGMAFNTAPPAPRQKRKAA